MSMTCIEAQIAPDLTSIDCLALLQGRPRDTFTTITVNQGFASKTKNIGYAQFAYPIDSPTAKQVWNAFSVTPRGAEYIDVPVMERHPYTTQSFIPLSVAKRASYLVVVAEDKQGRPNVHTMHAWLCHGGQMGIASNEQRRAKLTVVVTYAENQWHAPMIALHETLLFAVTNAENNTSDDLEEYFFTEANVPRIHVKDFRALAQQLPEVSKL